MLLALWAWREGEWNENTGGKPGYEGWSVFPNTRRKTKKQIYAERAKLGIVKETIEATAKQVVEKELSKNPSQVVDKTKIGYYYRPDIADLTTLLMVQLRLTVQSPDYTHAIHLAIEAKRQRDNEDDEEALLLLM